MTPSAAREHAVALDSQDPLSRIRDEFRIPLASDVTGNQLRTSALDLTNKEAESSKQCTYLCGNSLGLQPKRTSTRLLQYLNTWATQGVHGHFKPLDNSPLPTWVDADARAAKMMAPIVGARESEVAVMQTLTGNLHLLMSAFYKPDPKGRHKIILESKAFPSDHFAVESQIRHHGLSPATSMICIEPPSAKENLFSTEGIISTISEHAKDTALLLLPGIQYYTGQLLDIPTITAYARSLGIFVIWDLAHAAGNVPLSLHDWDVDAAAWCTYKYLNSGPGAIGALFVHERHSQLPPESSDEKYPDRLSGWWGNDKKTRFVMANRFRPVSGAAGFQLSNPSVADLTSVCASLELFGDAGGVVALRERSLRLTAYLQDLLEAMPEKQRALFRIITPKNPAERGAQLSLLLEDGLLDQVMKGLEDRAVVIDERKPDVVRVAPAPLYNSFADCFDFVEAFGAALVGEGESEAS